MILNRDEDKNGQHHFMGKRSLQILSLHYCKVKLIQLSFYLTKKYNIKASIYFHRFQGIIKNILVRILLMLTQSSQKYCSFCKNDLLNPVRVLSRMFHSSPTSASIELIHRWSFGNANGIYFKLSRIQKWHLGTPPICC